MSQVNVGKTHPDLYNAFFQLEKQFEADRAFAGGPRPLIHLQRLLASQINGCSFCQDMHTSELQEVGVDEQKIMQLPNWKISDDFSVQEKLALYVAESTCKLGQAKLNEEDMSLLRKEFSDQAISVLLWNCILINGWNRIAVQSGY